jgi:hypothetical protein
LPPKTFAALLALAACTGSAGWERDGVSPEAASRDLEQCRGEASRAVDRDVAIDQDIMSSRAQDLQRSGMMRLREDTMRTSNIGRYDEIVARCMAGRGYHRATG